ncbi:MAG: hypothetical protein AAF196_18765 [Planctomycetota bacterium]
MKARPVHHPSAVRLLQLREKAELEQAESDRRCSLLQATENALATIHSGVEQKLTEVAEIAAEFGLRLAEVALEESIDRGTGLEDRARRAIAALATDLSSQPIEVRVAPADHAIVQEALTGEPDVRVQVDASAGPGTVTAVSGTSAVTIDPRAILDDLLDRVRSELPG